jgi:hypothetical protein
MTFVSSAAGPLCPVFAQFANKPTHRRLSARQFQRNHRFNDQPIYCAQHVWGHA